MDQCIHSTTDFKSNSQIPESKFDVHKRVRNVYSKVRSHGVHPTTKMAAAGFRYTGEGDAAFCDTCKLNVSGWLETMQPLAVHMERSPQCSAILSRLPLSHSELNNEENASKRQKTSEDTYQPKYNFKFTEVKSMIEIRRRTFAHWPSRTQPSSERMIDAGFFSCNVGDRVICLYCNLICQQWKPNEEDPSEVHQTLSPHCPYVVTMLMSLERSATLILNENSTVISNTPDQQRFDQIVYTRPCHAHYSDLTKRLQSFVSWPGQGAPPVDDLVRAGFFYAGTGNVVTCFYCNGSLQNWGSTDNPVVEHARWFGHCPYARQLCGDDVHRRIQEANHRRRERQAANQLNDRNQTSNQLQFEGNGDRLLQRMVAARLDLPISQRMLDRNYKLSIIKRCWEDQLQLKKNDFTTDSDLLISCIILQKQIDCIQGNKDNIIIPAERMRAIREGKQSGSVPPAPTTNNATVERTENQTDRPTTSTPVVNEQSNISENKPSPSNPCIICFQDEKRLACIPCGHLAACVPCSHSLRTCPICRRSIDAFVRIYI